MEELNDNARMIVQAVLLRMLKRLKEQLEKAEKEAAEKEADGEEEPAAEVVDLPYNLRDESWWNPIAKQMDKDAQSVTFDHNGGFLRARISIDVDKPLRRWILIDSARKKKVDMYPAAAEAAPSRSKPAPPAPRSLPLEAAVAPSRSKPTPPAPRSLPLEAAVAAAAPARSPQPPKLLPPARSQPPPKLLPLPNRPRSLLIDDSRRCP
nr:actin cytoskeleton-regulatory complex protein PAN1-like [Aegilops tauschii subsp. strangulata]